MNNNQIQEIKGLDRLKKLKHLDLGGNQIKEIENLDSLDNLSFLDLSQNRISEVNGLSNLKNLTHLFLFQNKINRIKSGALDNLKRLQHLLLEDNVLTNIFELLKLKLESPLTVTLDLEKIPQAQIENLEILTERSGGWVSGNSKVKIRQL